MSSRLISRLILPATLFLTGSIQSSQAAVQSRISRIDTGSKVALHGTISSQAKRASVVGDAPVNRRLDTLTLFFSLTAAQQADLDQLLAAQVNPSSPSYHQWLTPEQYGARFGLSSSDLAKVSAWLTSQGLSVTSVARSSSFIQFAGTVAQAQQAFGVAIRSLSVDGEQHISNLTDPVLPSSVAGVVRSITGLNDFHMKPHLRPREVSLDPSKPINLRPSNTQISGGTTSHYMAPGDLYTIYDFPPYSATAGAGVTIAVMGQTDLNQSNSVPDPDVAAFRTAAGLPAINLRLQLAGTDPGVSTSDIDEAHLDVEWSGASAPGATILFVYGSDAFGNSLVYAVDNKVAPIITISYGGCETDFNSTATTSGPSQLAAYNTILAQANAQGMTVIGSAGDAGATDCDNLGGLAVGGLNVDFPGSSPYVTSSGGTMFSGDVNTPSTYWSSTNGANGGSALGYIPEQPWNETTALNGLSAGGSGGGGASAFFAKPSWQMGTGAGATPTDSSRDVPDFALNAAAMHDGYFVCSTGTNAQELPCTGGGFLDSTGNPNVFGGTSFVAPIMAGILARVEQNLGVGSTAATGLGNINSTLYGLANGPTYSSVFHDITSGNNAVPCTQGTPNCPNGGSIGYNAGTGYDQATGLGSFDVAKLISSWGSATPTGIGGTTSPGAISTTKLTTTASVLCGVTGSITLNVTVAGSIAGTTPSGTVQFFVDNAVIAGSSTTLANGTASYTLVTTTLSSGGHTISAVYSGDANYAGSKGTLLASDGTLASVDVVSTTKPDFSITPCTGVVSVSPGATATGIAFTVTPVNGFTGAVNLTASNDSNMVATTNFTVTPVNITSAAGVSTSFVVVASQTKTSGALRPGPGRPSDRPAGEVPWYAAGSGATLACVLLFTLPRRRRWAGLLVMVLSIAAFSATGCSNTSNTGGNTGGSGGTTPTVTNATAGTYAFTITGIASGGLVHSTVVTVTVP